MIRNLDDYNTKESPTKSSNNAISLLGKDIRKIERRKVKRVDSWREQGILKRKYGYNVQHKTSVSFRRRCLEKAYIKLGVIIVKRELHRYIFTAKKRKDKKYVDAIKKWENDLQFIEELTKK
ncbi:MAG: hypothetical protein JW840_00105 [Candidatus Thermoplasmatota archaeon]|nr:hypothetical protein [Candidatus Thermoplasmatota archaeon]